MSNDNMKEICKVLCKKDVFSDPEGLGWTAKRSKCRFFISGRVYTVYQEEDDYPWEWYAMDEEGDYHDIRHSENDEDFYEFFVKHYEESGGGGMYLFTKKELTQKLAEAYCQQLRSMTVDRPPHGDGILGLDVDVRSEIMSSHVRPYVDGYDKAMAIGRKIPRNMTISDDTFMEEFEGRVYDVMVKAERELAVWIADSLPKLIDLSQMEQPWERI